MQLTKLYQYLLNFSIVTRWILFIIPVLALLWIPGILSLTVYPAANVSNIFGGYAQGTRREPITRYGASN